MSEVVDKFVFGGLSCMGAATVTNPIDVIKVRLQLQGELNKTSETPKYNGFIKGGVTILQEEGIKGLYKGLAPSLIREGSYSTLRMGLYEPFKQLLVPKGEAVVGLEFPLWKKIIAGGLAGACGAAIANPTDLIKVRMQAESSSSNKRYKNVIDAGKKIYNSEGIPDSSFSINVLKENSLIFLRGVSPTTQRAMILTASQLPSYDHSKHFLLQLNYFQEGTILHITASMIAGFVCATTTSPIDLVKILIS